MYMALSESGRLLKTQFEEIFTSKLIKSSQLDGTYSRKDFQAYTGKQPQDFKERIIKDFDFIQKYKIESILNDNEIEQRMNAKRNECNDKGTSGDDTDIRPSYDTKQMAEVPYTAKYNVFAVKSQHFEKPESINDAYVMERDDSNVITDSSNMFDNDNQDDQNTEACDDESVVLANLIENLKLDIDENKKIQKQAGNANTSLTQELKECKSTLEETKRTLRESNSTRDSFLIALQNKQPELEKYKAFNGHTIDYDKLECKLKETQAVLAQKEHDTKEGLKLKAYEISIVKEKHDELVKQSLLTTSSYKGLVKEKHKFERKKASIVFLKERDQYFEIQDLKAQLQDKNIAISELNKLIEKMKGRIFTQIGLKWMPIRKFVEARYNTNDSASPLGKETHNPNTIIYENSSSLSVEHIIVAGAENRPPMLETKMYDSWENCIVLFNLKGRNMTRPKKYSELTKAKQLQDDCDVKAMNIILHGLPPYVMTMQQVQVNTKFLNALPSEWSKFVTNVKYPDPLAFVANSPTLYNLFQSPQHLGSLIYPPPQQFTPVYAAPIHHQHHHTLVNPQKHLISPQPFISPSMTQQSQAEFPQLDSSLAVPMFQQGEDPIECINKAMEFLSNVVSRFPPLNNQLKTSSNPRNQATIKDGRVTVQQVQGRQNQSYAGTRNRGIATTSKGNVAAGPSRVMKCYNCQGEGHMARQCTQPKRPRNAAWFKEKLMLAEAQEAGQILDEEQITDDLDAYDSNCDDLSLAKAVLMANLSSCEHEVLSKVPYSDSYSNDMINQDVQEI
ncbi:retrovirus-related pol polyprotein from transposon TNT 1-94 [Tanacetum coccineum]